MLLGSSVLVVRCWGWEVVVGVVGVSLLRMVVDGHEWSWMVADGLGWLRMDLDGCGWLRMEWMEWMGVDGCGWSGWVWMDADGRRWLCCDYQVGCKEEKNTY